MTEAAFISKLKKWADLPFVRWTAFSGFSFLMIVSLTSLLHEVFHVGERLAFLSPLVILYFTNFFVCRYFVYQSTDQSIPRQFLAYSLSSVGFRIVEYLTYWVLLDGLGVWYIAAMLIVMPTSFVVKFLFFKVIVFRHRDRTSAAGYASKLE